MITTKKVINTKKKTSEVLIESGANGFASVTLDTFARYQLLI